MSKKQTSGHYQRRGGRVVYELTTPDGRTITLTHPTGHPARDEKLAGHLAECRFILAPKTAQ